MENEFVWSHDVARRTSALLFPRLVAELLGWRAETDSVEATSFQE